MDNPSFIKHVDPFQWAVQGKTLEKAWDLRDFGRLEEAVGLPQTGQAVCALRFYCDEGGRALIEGHLSSTLILRCERCLEPFNYLVNSNFLVAPLNKEKKAEGLPKHIEPLIILDKALSLGPFIEDEVLLSLPVVAWHVPAECPQGQWHSGYSTSPLLSEREQDEVESQEHPFASLKALKEQLAQNMKDEVIEE